MTTFKTHHQADTAYNKIVGVIEANNPKWGMEALMEEAAKQFQAEHGVDYHELDFPREDELTANYNKRKKELIDKIDIFQLNIPQLMLIDTMQNSLDQMVEIEHKNGRVNYINLSSV